MTSKVTGSLVGFFLAYLPLLPRCFGLSVNGGVALISPADAASGRTLLFTT